MKVVIQCSQCERKSGIQEERLKDPEKKRIRCSKCGAFYDQEAINEALANHIHGQG